MSTSISHLSFQWADGSAVFDDLDLTVSQSRHGLVGLNGCGKSTLLRLIAGDLVPVGGTVSVDGRLAYLPQDAGADSYRNVEEILGIAAIRAALSAVESGDAAVAHFDTIGNDWDIDEHAAATLGRLGLGNLSLDRRVETLSGGELVLLSLASKLLTEPDVLLLDEPTNSLDRAARQRLYDVVAAWRGTLLVVSHDRELLNLMDNIGELHDGGVRWFGGNFDDYEQAIAEEQRTAERAVRTAEGNVRKQERELIEARIKLDRRKRYGQTMWDQKREPKIVMGARKRAAQESAGKHRNMHLERLADANEHLDDAESKVRSDREIRVDLPRTAVPEGRTVLTLSEVRLPYDGPVVELDVRGPERIDLVGRNGAGKTTLLRTVVGDLSPESGDVRVHVPARYVPQKVDVLDDGLSVFDNAKALAPESTDNEVRTSLARFLFRGPKADQPAGSLSGGELLRATLACLLLAEPAPQLLLLDEPTNNLDLASIRQLGEALKSYKGALIVASHDTAFLDEIGLTRIVGL